MIPSGIVRRSSIPASSSAICPTPPDAAERAERIIGSHARLLITPGTLAEAAFVLTKFYGVPRAPVVDALIALLRRINVHVHGLDKTIAIQALLLCRPSSRVSSSSVVSRLASR